ncbi:MAG: MurR/RpiR family transcriptional regulator, partial [Coprobacillaceae bacterium]
SIKPDTTITELAGMCYTSDSSLSRLALKLGYKNFNAFKQDILGMKNEFDDLFIDNNFFNHMSGTTYMNIVCDSIKNIDHEKLVKDIDYLCQLIMLSDNIYFFATHIPGDMTKIIQRATLAAGKYVTFYTDREMQLALAKTTKRDDLCIFISLEGTLVSEKKITLPIVASGSRMVLITQIADMKFSSYFDYVISLGERNKDFTGKFKLLYFIDCFIYQFFHYSNQLKKIP